MNGETSKKVTSAERDCRLCKDKIPSLEEKVKIFRKSELQIGALIHRSLGSRFGCLHRQQEPRDMLLVL